MFLIFFLPFIIYLSTTSYQVFFSKNLSYFFCFILSVLLAFFGACHIELVNLDYYLYQAYFDALGTTSYFELLSFPDTLFWSLAKTFNLFFGDTPFLNYFFIIIISIFLKFVIAKENLPSVLVPIFLYLVFSRYLVLHDYTQLRASLAISVGTIIYLRFLQNGILNKIELFFLILSIFIHVSAVIFIPFYFLKKIMVHKKNFNILLFILFFCVIIGQFFSNVFHILLSFFSSFDRISVYLNKNSEGSEQIQTYSIFQFYFLLKTFLLFFLIKFYKSYTSSDRSILFIYVVAMCIQSAFVFNSAIGLRLTSVFGYIDIMAMLLPLKYSNFNKIHSLYYVCFFIVGCIFLYSSLLGIWDRI